MAQPKNAAFAFSVAAAATDVQITPSPPAAAAGQEQQVPTFFLRGVSLWASAGVATIVYIRQGSASGPIVMAIPLAAASPGRGLTIYLSHGGVQCTGGIFLDRDGTNNVEGAIWYS